MKERVAWVDVAKGIGIVLVVYGHVYKGLVSAGLASVHSPLQTVCDAIYAFHMPLFFLLAGLFAASSLRKGQTHFWRTKILLLAYTYVLWSLLQGGLQSAFADFANHPPTLAQLFRLWEPTYQFWFLYALLGCRIMFALLHRFGERWLVATATLAFLATWHFDLGLAGIVLWGYFYFAIGAALAAASSGNGWPAAWSAGLALAFGIVALATHAAGLTQVATVSTALCGIAATVLVSVGLAGRATGLRVLGNATMSIFVLHVIAAGATRAALSRIVHVDDLTVHLIAGTAAGLVLPLVVQMILTRAGALAAFGLAGDLPFQGPLSASARWLRRVSPRRAALPASGNPGG